LVRGDLYVGIYWQSYGWVAPDEQIFGLEDEYQLSAGLPRLIYVKSPAPEREPRLTELLARIRCAPASASPRPTRRRWQMSTASPRRGQYSASADSRDLPAAGGPAAGWTWLKLVLACVTLRVTLVGSIGGCVASCECPTR